MKRLLLVVLAVLATLSLGVGAVPDTATAGPGDRLHTSMRISVRNDTCTITVTARWNVGWTPDYVNVAVLADSWINYGNYRMDTSATRGSLKKVFTGAYTGSTLHNIQAFSEVIAGTGGISNYSDVKAAPCFTPFTPVS